MGAGEIFGGILGLAGKIAGNDNAKLAEKRQFQNEMNLMKLQASYNKEQAKYSQQLAKDMWESTNYEAQVRHLKAAGLNPALMYGQGGGGGASTDGGEAQGVSMGTSQAVMMGLQAKAMESEIAKTMAETAKITTETEKVKTDTDLSTEMAETQRTIQVLNTREAELTTTNIAKANEQWKILTQQFRQEVVKGNIAEKTEQAEIDRIGQEAINSVYKGLEYFTNAELNEEKKKQIREMLLQGWKDLAIKEWGTEIQEKEVNALVDKLVQEAKRIGQGIDLDKEKNLREWIYGGVNAGGEVINAISEFLPWKKVISILKSMNK